MVRPYTRSYAVYTLCTTSNGEERCRTLKNFLSGHDLYPYINVMIFGVRSKRTLIGTSMYVGGVEFVIGNGQQIRNRRERCISVRDQGNHPILFRIGHVCVGTRWWRRPKTGKYEYVIGPIVIRTGVGPSEQWMLASKEATKDFARGFMEGTQETRKAFDER